MKVLLDTNIILDALQERRPFDTAAKEILQRSQNGEFSCCFTANAASDIFYIYSKVSNTKAAKIALNFLLNTYKVISVTHEDCINAMSFPLDDFEDALVAVCAKKSNVDYIVSRDEKFLNSKSDVNIITANGLLTEICK